MTDAYRIEEVNPYETEVASSRPPNLGPLTDSDRQQLGNLLRQYPAKIVLREIAALLKEQAGEYLNQPDANDPELRQNAVLRQVAGDRILDFSVRF